MDIVGARELARRLGAKAEIHLDAAPPRPLAAKDAAPIFHWFGVEPRRGDDAPGRPQPSVPAAGRAAG